MDDPDRFFDTALVVVNFKSDEDIILAIEWAARANIVIIAIKTLAGGYATDALGKTSPHQAAIKWVLRNPNITAAIPGMKDLSHIKEDIAVMGMSCELADERILQRYHAAVKPYYCHLCGKCEGTCPMGVEISTINHLLMYAEGYRNHELALSTYHEDPCISFRAGVFRLFGVRCTLCQWAQYQG